LAPSSSNTSAGQRPGPGQVRVSHTSRSRASTLWCTSFDTNTVGLAMRLLLLGQ
jgi:hypothetical protein